MAKNKENDYRGNGTDHRVWLKTLTLSYWKNNHSCGHADADRVVVFGPMGCEFDLAMPSQEPLLRRIIQLSEESFAAGKKQAKLELRRWLEIQ